MADRICKDCGADKYFAREFPRVRDEARYWREQVTRLNVRVAELEADAEYQRYKDRTDAAWLQGKVVAQRRELKRLNDAANAQLIRADLEPEPDVSASSLTSVEVDSRRRDAREERRDAIQ
jgi:hypothetical protein